MKNLLHPDGWVEIPEGEFLTGLSEGQREQIFLWAYERCGYFQLSPHQQLLVAQLLQKISALPEQAGPDFGASFWQLFTSAEEKMFLQQEPIAGFFQIARQLLGVLLQTPIHLGKFYILRFPLTNQQHQQLLTGVHPGQVPLGFDGLFSPDPKINRWTEKNLYSPENGVAIITTDKIIDIGKLYGWRLPTYLEWEKTARGTDGRLYPWGNVWNESAGQFYSGRRNRAYPRLATAYPEGVSPYGAWAMAGGLPQMIINLQGVRSVKGCLPKATSETMAWFDNIAALPGKGDRNAFRPVLDQWPHQQWRGFRADTAEAITPQD